MNHKPYLVSLTVQSLILNVQNSIYPLALPNVACREPIIPPISIPLTRNVMEQNLIGFPNSMYPHVGPYTPYFSSGYRGIRSVHIMWLLVSNPLTNLATPLKPISKIAQVKL